MLVKQTLEEFIQSVDSSSPAPGGGSVSALVSSLGSALSRMVGHLTTSKKSFLKLDEKIQAKIMDEMNQIESIQAKLVSLIDEDTDAFQKMMESYAMKKETEEEKHLRNLAIQKATQKGIEVPLSVMKLSNQVLQHLEVFIKYGNKSAISDVGVGVYLLTAGMHGAFLNVKINLPSLKDHEQRNQYLQEAISLLENAEDLKENYLEQINEYLNQSMV